MTGNLQPLVNNQPIVKSDGTPTDYFIRWAQQKQIDISGGITADQAQALIDAATADLVPNTREIIAGTGLDGGGDLSADRTIDLADTAVAPGTYGDATHSARVTIDQQGRITAASNVTISGGGGGGSVYVGIPPTIIFHSPVAFGFNNWGGRGILIADACTIDAIVGYVTAASATSKFVPAIYSNVANAIGTLLGSGPQVTGVTVGVNIWPLTTPIAVAAGTVIWVGGVLTIAAINCAQVLGQDTCFFGATTPPSTAPGATYGSGTSMCFWARHT